MSSPISNTKILNRAGAELAANLSHFPTVSDIDAGFADGKVQLDFSLYPAGLNLGLTAAEVAAQVRGAFFGTEALRQQRGRNEVKVMVRLPENERASEYDLDQLLIRAPNGIEVPLYEVARVDRGRAYTSINRKNGRRTITVSANVTPAAEAERIMGEATRTILPALMRKYPGLSWSSRGGRPTSGRVPLLCEVGVVFALLMIYVMLAIPFRNYSQPLIVMISIPFGMIGAVIGHIIMGYNLSLMSLMGIVALSGVVVNDALVLIDFINRKPPPGWTLLKRFMPPGSAVSVRFSSPP